MQSQHLDPFQDSALDELVEQTLADWKVPGLAISIVHGDQTFSKGYGLAHVDNGVPVTPQTQFYAASTTKAFVAAVASLLVDDERLPHVQWQSSIYDIMRSGTIASPDDFVLADDYWTKHVTLEDALCHRTGLPRHDLSLGRSQSTVRDSVRILRHLPFTRAPRTVFQYCNLMYLAVQHAIECTTGRTLPQLMYEQLWRPLGMENTTDGIDRNLPPASELAMGYYFQADQERLVEVGQPYLPGDFGAGGMITTILDSAMWIKAMLRRSSPISAEAHKELVTPRIHFDAGLPQELPARFYGLGWRMTWYFQHKIIWHTGGIRGFSALVMYIPARDWGATMLSNSMDAGNKAHERLMWHLIDELLQIDPALRFDWDAKNKRKDAISIRLFENAVQEPQNLYQDLAFARHLDLETRRLADLHSFTGVFHHPGYGKLTLYIQDDSLKAAASERNVPYEMSFRHVHNEHFVAYMRPPSDDEMIATKGRFLYEGAKVTELSLDYQQDLGPTTIKFIKVSDLARSSLDPETVLRSGIV